MSNPMPGKKYIVQDGDTLSGISSRAYGDPVFWPRIYSANQTVLKSNDPDLIYPGETIIIPVLAEDQKLKTQLANLTLENKAKESLTIIVDSLEIPFNSARIIRTMDTAADGWTASVNWTPGKDLNLDKKLKPFKFFPASVYIGSDLIVNGLLYTTFPSLAEQGQFKNLEGWSFTADVIDSTLKPPYERNKITLEQLIPELIKPIGINAVFEVETGGKFDRVTANATDTIFSHISKLTSQRGVLVSSTPSGDLLIWKANSGSPVGTLKEGENFVLNWNARYDGRNLYNSYRGIGQSPGGNSKTAISIDDNVPRSRFKTINLNDTISGNIQSAVDWQRSKQLATALTLPLSVSDWFDPKGNLWRENTIVSVISPSLDLSDGVNLLIRSVEYEIMENKRSATLNVVPSEVYTGEQIPYIWN